MFYQPVVYYVSMQYAIFYSVSASVFLFCHFFRFFSVFFFFFFFFFIFFPFCDFYFIFFFFFFFFEEKNNNKKKSSPFLKKKTESISCSLLKLISWLVFFFLNFMLCLTHLCVHSWLQIVYYSSFNYRQPDQHSNIHSL